MTDQEIRDTFGRLAELVERQDDPEETHDQELERRKEENKMLAQGIRVTGDLLIRGVTALELLAKAAWPVERRKP